MHDRYMKDWSDPWLQDRQAQAELKELKHGGFQESVDSGGAAGSGIAREETIPAQPSQVDADIEANAKAMLKVKGQQTFRSIRGNPMEKNPDTARKSDDSTPFQEVQFDEFWPSEKSQGSIFSYDNWEIYRERVFEREGTDDVYLVRPSD